MILWQPLGGKADHRATHQGAAHVWNITRACFAKLQGRSQPVMEATCDDDHAEREKERADHVTYLLILKNEHPGNAIHRASAAANPTEGRTMPAGQRGESRT